MNICITPYTCGYYVQKDTTNDTQGSERYNKRVHSNSLLSFLVIIPRY